MAAADIGVLKKISFFADHSDFDLAQIAAITEAHDYRPGERIVEERTAAERFFIIVRGKIQISKRFADGDEFVLSVHSDGEFFGEMGLLDEGPRSATVRAVEATTLLEITRTDFETLLYKAPLLAYRILRELSIRLRETGALLVSFLERRNAQTCRAYLQTMEGFLRRTAGQDPAGIRQVERARDLARAAGPEMGLLEEEVLIAEIGVILRALRIPSEPPALPAAPSSRAARLAAACEGFAELLAEAPGSPPGTQEVKRRLGPRFDEEAAATLLTLWQGGRLPVSQ
jgi:CRP/FNR family cyclic AMP-dependent transcriptional regulator